jgi:Mesyanzhinovviridae DNA polymerase
MRRQKNIHIGGEQLLLISPPSSWEPPTELPDLRKGHVRVALDTETKDNGLRTGWGPGWPIKDGHICGVSLAWREGKCVKSGYWPLRHPDSSCFQPDQVRRWLKDHMRSGVRFTFMNAGYDLGWLDAELALWPRSKIDDVGAMAYMLDEQRLNYSLNGLCKWKELPTKDETLLKEAASAYGVDPKEGLYRLPARYVGQYAEQDAISTLLLAEELQPEIEEQDLQEAYQLEMDLVPMILEMRKRGIRIDVDKAEQLQAKFREQVADSLSVISDKLGHTTTLDMINDSKFLAKAFDSQNFVYPYTERGAPSFTKAWMSSLQHWLPQNIIRARSRSAAAEKFIGTYLLGYMRNGRVYANAHHYRAESPTDEDDRGGGTRTYRFSYTDPPLQQIPMRDKEMAEIRTVFIPEKGQKWASLDYSQQEYRLMVHYASLPRPRHPKGLTGAEDAASQYRDDPNTDFHSMVAEMTGLDRKPAKDCNFAKAYGAGVRKFATMIGKSEQEAEAIMKQYDERMPFVKMLFDECHDLADRRGYIRLLDGARIRFDWWVGRWREKGVEWNQQNAHADCRREEAERRIRDPMHPWFGSSLRRSRCNKGMNSLIQGGAARQTKIAMRDCYRAGHLPLLQIHDELCFSVRTKREAEEIQELMLSAVPLRVPMRVDLEIGPSWGAAS